MMKRTFVIAMVAAVASAALVLLVCDARPLQAQAGAGGKGYSVAGGGEHPVLIDPNTGKTWVLVVAKDPRYHVWVPVKRLDTDGDVRKWMITSKLRE